MKIFIFGAGASQGSQGDSGINPVQRAPLMNQLFDDHYVGYGNQVCVSPSELSNYKHVISTESPLEVWLTDEWTKIEKLKEETTKRAKRGFFGRLAFYLWWVLLNVSKEPGQDSYRKLLEKLVSNDEAFGLISFNYDTLLDVVVEDVMSCTLNNLENYVKAPLIKPHGSVNWFLQKRDRDGNIFGEQSLDKETRARYAANLMFNGAALSMKNIQIVPPRHPDLRSLDFITSSRFSNQYFYPLIFMPLTVKTYGFVVEFEKRIIEEGKKILAQATEIYVIGYRAQDDLIRELLSSVNPDVALHVVGNSSPEVVQEYILSRSTQLKKGQTYKGFRAFSDSY